MNGDRMDTDIISGIEAGLRTVLVLTGAARRRTSPAFPSALTSLNSVADLPDVVRGGPVLPA